jgi:hypothetical protein
MRAAPAIAAPAAATVHAPARASADQASVQRERREPAGLSNQAMQRMLSGGPPREGPPRVSNRNDHGASTALATARAGLAGSARPLPAYPRRFLEARFRADFSGVRIHTDERAADSAARLHAAAYTLGDRIAFGRGGYAPHTDEGLRLLGHELAHVVQSRGARIAAAASAHAIETPAHEHEADRAVDAIARGGHASVPTRVAAAVPLLHPVYISRHGSQGFLDEALGFYRAWGVSPIMARVDSIEQILTDLAGKSSIGRVTIVSHAHPEQVFLALINGGGAGITSDDWGVDTLAELPELETHVLDEDSLDHLVTALRGDATHRARLARIGRHTDPIVRQFLWWAFEFEYVSRAGFSSARRARLRRITQQNANRYKDTILLATAAVAGFGGGGPVERDFTQLRASITAVAATLRFPRPGPREQRDIERAIRRSPNAAINRVLRNPTFIQNLRSVRAKVSADSWIEVQGCRAGQNLDYLRAMRRFFTGPNGAPRVSAPDWFQYFGHYGFTTVANSPRALQAQWRRRRVQEALEYWMPIITGNAVPLGADWQTLRDYLAAGNVLPLSYPGTPGVLSMLIPAAMARETFLAWLARHSYRLTSVDDIRDQFARHRRIGQLVRGVPVDWLQEHSDREGVPTEIAFRPDPEYQQHIKSVP